MRNLVPITVLVAILAAPAALAGHATPNLDDLTAAVALRLSEQDQEPLTKAEKKCVKAFEKASELLAKDSVTTKADLKLLMKVERALRRWFATELAALGAVEASVDAFALTIAAELGVVRDDIVNLEREKDVKKIEKLLKKIEERLERAKREEKVQKSIRQLLHASGLSDKLFKSHARAPRRSPPPASSPGRVLTIGPGAGNVPRLLSFELPKIPGRPVVTQEIPTGTGSADEVVFGGLLAYVLANEGVFDLDLDDSDAQPVHRTPHVIGIDELVSVSPKGDRAVVMTLAGDLFLVKFDGTTAVPVGTGSAEVSWAPNETDFLLRTFGNTPPGSRLDYVLEAPSGYSTVPLGGPAVDGNDSGDGVISPNGDRVVWLGTSTTDGRTRCFARDLTTGQERTLSDSVRAMDWGQDFATGTTVAGIWSTNDRILVGLSPQGFGVFEFTTGVDTKPLEIQDTESRGLRVLSNTDAGSTIFASTPGRLFLTNPVTSGVIQLGADGLSETTTDIVGDTLYYANRNGTDPIDVIRRDLVTGDEDTVFTPVSDPSRAPDTYVRGLRGQRKSLAGRFADILMCNVETPHEDDGGLAIWLLTTPKGPPGASLRNLLREKGKDTTVTSYGFELLELADGTLRYGVAAKRLDFGTGNTSLVATHGRVEENLITSTEFLEILEKALPANYEFDFLD